MTEAFYRVIKNDEPGLSRQQIRAKSRKEAKKFNRDDSYLENAREITEAFNSEIFGIFSVAQTHNNLLMWSHYASNHEGFAVRFNYEKLVKFCTKYFFDKEKLLEAREIIYQTDYPVLIPTIEDDVEYMFRPLTMKSELWSYEKEYRLIVYEGANENVILPDGIIEAVLFGCKMTTEFKLEIKELTKNKNIKLIETKMHNEKYALQYKVYE